MGNRIGAELGVLLVVSLLLGFGVPGRAHAQVFHDEHPGIWAMATAAWKKPGHMSGPEVHDCAGGPGGMMVVAKEYGGFEAVGAGTYDAYPFYTDLVGKGAFEVVSGGVGLGRRPAVENSGDYSTYYVGFSCDTGMNTPGSHLFLMDLDGHVEKVVDVTEFTAVVPAMCAGVTEIGVGSGDMLLVMLSGPSNEQRHLVSVDLDGVPGERVSSVLSEAELVALLPEKDGQKVVDVTWGALFAVDDQDRVFLPVTVMTEGAEGPTGQHSLIVRLDPDGTLVEMTQREQGGGDLTSSLYVASRPAMGMQGGLEFDPATGLIVGTGYGIWLLHPDRPGSAVMIVAPEQVEGLAEALVADDWDDRSRFAAIGGSCLARTEAGFFAAKMITYAAFQYDPVWLDLDGDGLKGHQEVALGTDPWSRDTDGGGIRDGLEQVDISDPLDGSDDRVWGRGPSGIALTDEHVDAAFTQTFEPYGLAQHGAALWDGSVVVSKFEEADQGTLHRLAGYSVPGQLTDYPSTEMPLAADRFGNLYTVRRGATPSDHYLAKMTPKGQVEEAIPGHLIAALVAEGEPTPRAWSVDPDGRIWAGFDQGKIIRYTPFGIAEPIYNGWQDLINAGYLGSGGEQLRYGCTLYLQTQAMAWEPVHGVMLIALNRLYDCGMNGSFVSPVFVSVGYDDRLARVGSSADYPEIASWKGGGDVLDIEPDWQGGFYLLLAHGVDRTLVHYDANWQPAVMRDLSPEKGPEGSVLVLNYATDVVVTPDGGHYIIMGRQWGETPVHFVLRRFEPVTLEERTATLSASLPGLAVGPQWESYSVPAHQWTGPVEPESDRDPGACSTQPAGPLAGLWLLSVLMVALVMVRRWPGLLCAALLLVQVGGCAGPSNSPATPPDSASETEAGSDQRASDVTMRDDAPEMPETVRVDACGTMDECEPTAFAECVTESSHRRCQMTAEGCWVWSKALECPAGQACSYGVCQECLPTCAPGKTCGNDGCGGTCGECEEGLTCCLDFFCGTCESDCTDRECGADGNGGSCGECQVGQACAMGSCQDAGSGRCRDLIPCLNDCIGWDQTCVDNCEEYLDASSHERVAAYLACTGVHCVNCPDGEGGGAACFDSCVLEHCAESFAECVAQGGTAECKPMYECVFACEPSDADCVDSCYQSAFPSHLLYAIELELCVGQYCAVFPPDPAGWACWEEAVTGPCNAPFLSCMQGDCDSSCEGMDCGLNDCLLPCGPDCQ